MSLSFVVYCKNISQAFVPKMMERLNELDMIVEVHPDFRFDKEDDSGFVPFKFRLKEPYHSELKEKELRSGFELYIDAFNLEAEKKSIQPKQGFFDRLRGKKPDPVPFAPYSIEEKLKECKYAISFVWHGGDVFQLRFASLVSAVVSELSGGVRSYTADDIWYENTGLVNKELAEIKEYECSLNPQDLIYEIFEQW